MVEHRRCEYVNQHERRRQHKVIWKIYLEWDTHFSTIKQNHHRLGSESDKKKWRSIYYRRRTESQPMKASECVILSLLLSRMLISANSHPITSVLQKIFWKLFLLISGKCWVILSYSTLTKLDTKCKGWISTANHCQYYSVYVSQFLVLYITYSY